VHGKYALAVMKLPTTDIFLSSHVSWIRNCLPQHYH